MTLTLITLLSIYIGWRLFIRMIARDVADHEYNLQEFA